MIGCGRSWQLRWARFLIRAPTIHRRDATFAAQVARLWNTASHCQERRSQALGLKDYQRCAKIQLASFAGPQVNGQLLFEDFLRWISESGWRQQHWSWRRGSARPVTSISRTCWTLLAKWGQQPPTRPTPVQSAADPAALSSWPVRFQTCRERDGKGRQENYEISGIQNCRQPNPVTLRLFAMPASDFQEQINSKRRRGKNWSQTSLPGDWPALFEPRAAFFLAVARNFVITTTCYNYNPAIYEGQHEIFEDLKDLKVIKSMRCCEHRAKSAGRRRQLEARPHEDMKMWNFYVGQESQSAFGSDLQDEQILLDLISRQAPAKRPAIFISYNYFIYFNIYVCLDFQHFVPGIP